MDGILSLNASVWQNGINSDSLTTMTKKANLARPDSLGVADSLVLDGH